MPLPLPTKFFPLVPLCRVPPAFCCSVSIHPPTQSGVATNTRNGNDVFAAAVNCAELSLKFEVPEKERAIQTMDEASILPGRQSNRLNFPLNVRSCFPFRFSSLEETSIWNMTRSHTEVCPKRKFVCNDRKFCSLERSEGSFGRWNIVTTDGAFSDIRSNEKAPSNELYCSTGKD